MRKGNVKKTLEELGYEPYDADYRTAWKKRFGSYTFDVSKEKTGWELKLLDESCFVMACVNCRDVKEGEIEALKIAHTYYLKALQAVKAELDARGVPCE